MAQANKQSGTDAQQLEVNNVLKHYLQLFHPDCRQFNLCMGPNSAVDWFGRTICGPIKIQDYLRNEVCSQYEHIEFNKAEECEPIERKPMHMKTKITPTGDVDFVRRINKVSGLTSLKNYADSDAEGCEDIETPSIGNKTPERVENSVIEELTPPASAAKKGDDDGDFEADGNDEDEDEIQTKRLRRTHPSPFTYLRRLPTKAQTTSLRTNPNDIRTLLDDDDKDCTSDEEDGATSNSEYTPLRYIEAIGILVSPPGDMSHRSSYISVDDDCWERKTRIRISYRKCISNQEIQFALIIYEHFVPNDTKTTTSRRHLMSEFTRAAATAPAPLTNDHDYNNSIAPSTVVSNTYTTEIVDILPEIPESPSRSALDILRTPTKSVHTPPATPKRTPRPPYAMSGMKRLSFTPSTTPPKRSAARNLRL